MIIDCSVLMYGGCLIGVREDCKLKHESLEIK